MITDETTVTEIKAQTLEQAAEMASTTILGAGLDCNGGRPYYIALEVSVPNPNSATYWTDAAKDFDGNDCEFAEHFQIENEEELGFASTSWSQEEDPDARHKLAALIADYVLTGGYV